MYKIEIVDRWGHRSCRTFPTLNDCKNHIHKAYNIENVHVQISFNEHLILWSTFNEVEYHEDNYAAMFCPIIDSAGRTNRIF